MKYLHVLRPPVAISLFLTACSRKAPASKVVLHLTQLAWFARGSCGVTRQSLMRFPVGGTADSIGRRSAAGPWRPLRRTLEVSPVPVCVIITTDMAPGCCAPAPPPPRYRTPARGTNRWREVGAQGGWPLTRGNHTRSVLLAHTLWEFHCARRARLSGVG